MGHVAEDCQTYPEAHQDYLRSKRQQQQPQKGDEEPSSKELMLEMAKGMQQGGGLGGMGGGLPPGMGGLPRGITLPAGLSGLMKKK